MVISSIDTLLYLFSLLAFLPKGLAEEKYSCLNNLSTVAFEKYEELCYSSQLGSGFQALGLQGGGILFLHPWQPIVQWIALTM